MAERLRPVIEAAQNKDTEALNQLASCVDRFVRIFHRKLSRQVRRCYGSTIDFVLEGLGEALSELGNFEYRSDEEFYAWISSRIRSRIVDAARKVGAQKRGERAVELHDHDAKTDDPRPSEIMAQGELKNVLAQAIIELQIEHAQEMEVVLLKIFEGYTWTEIKSWQGLTSEKRARTLFARGVDLLRPYAKQALGDRNFSELLGM